MTSEVLYIEKNRVFLRAVEGLVGERAYLVAHGDKCEFVPRLEVDQIGPHGFGMLS